MFIVQHLIFDTESIVPLSCAPLTFLKHLSVFVKQKAECHSHLLVFLSTKSLINKKTVSMLIFLSPV